MGGSMTASFAFAEAVRSACASSEGEERERRSAVAEAHRAKAAVRGETIISPAVRCIPPNYSYGDRCPIWFQPHSNP
jgi:hypothetical protein